MDEFAFSKRKNDWDETSGRKAPKMTANGGPSSSKKKMTFAERMMSKMGYEEGKGLGRRGDGILKPIEVVVRPQGVGVGAVKERTAQERAEARRIAQQRGLPVDDLSSDDEDDDGPTRRRGRQQKQKTKTEKGPGAAVPKVRLPKYRTSADIEAAASGLKVPTVLKSIIDATGPGQRVLTSMTGLVSGAMAAVAVPAETEAEKLARRARQDLERYVEQWNGFAERRRYINSEERTAKRTIEKHDDELGVVRRVGELAESLERISIARPAVGPDGKADLAAQWDEIMPHLETLQTEYRTEVKRYGLSDLAVASIRNLFRQEMTMWDPLADPTHLVPHLLRFRSVLGIGKLRDPRKKRDRAPRRSTTPYESLIHTFWLPRLRRTVTSEWDVRDPGPMLDVVKSWMEVLPDFVYNRLVNDVVATKLHEAIDGWNPRRRGKSGPSGSSRLPHTWLFPWFPYLSADHVDVENDTGLVYAVKQQFGHLLRSWDLSRGVVPGLDEWRDVLGPKLDHVVVSTVLPRLARVLALDFIVHPPDQDLSPVTTVLAWRDVLKPAVLGQLLVSEFFPKVVTVLHTWLTSDEVDFDEVRTWYRWWQSQIPGAVNAEPGVVRAWRCGSELMAEAFGLDRPRDRQKLALPDLKGLLSAPAPASSARSSPAPAAGPGPEPDRDDGSAPAEASFTELLMEWCDDESVIMMPLKELHPTAMVPLFRISASATARGGVVVYVKDGVVWAQDRRNKEAWEPVEVGAELLARAEGR